MEAVKISVVIPTFRRPALLQKCLTAILNQSFPATEYEVLVVSDGYDPESEITVNAFANGLFGCISYLHLDRKRGPAAARNFGWKQSKGALIVFTDDDCIPETDWLANYWKAFQLHNEQLVAFTGRVEVPVPTQPTDYEKNVAHLSTAEFVTANCACSRAALQCTGGFDENFEAAWREDSDLQFRLIQCGIPVLHIRSAAVCHPARPAPWGVSLAEQRKSMFNALLFKKHPRFYRGRISGGPVWHYYAIIIASLVALPAFILGSTETGFAAMVVWGVAVLLFAFKRLNGTNPSFSHRAEMLFTSVLIPYLSVYWTIRGALRYKVFFL